MSGGSYNYFYSRLDSFASEVRDSVTEDCFSAEAAAARLLFADHMEAAAEAARAIEWVDSGDWGHSREMEALNAYFALHGNITSHAQASLAKRLREMADLLEAHGAAE